MVPLLVIVLLFNKTTFSRCTSLLLMVVVGNDPGIRILDGNMHFTAAARLLLKTKVTENWSKMSMIIFQAFLELKWFPK